MFESEHLIKKNPKIANNLPTKKTETASYLLSETNSSVIMMFASSFSFPPLLCGFMLVFL